MSNSSTASGKVPGKMNRLRAAVSGMASNSTVKGALVGGISAALVTTMLTSTKPATASATVLLGPLATIEGMIDKYMSVMNDYVNQWIADLSGLISDDVWVASQNETQGIYDSVETSTREQAAYHARGDAPYLEAVNSQLAQVRSDDGRIDPEKAARRLSPPTPIARDELNNASMEGVWEHALLVTGDEPLQEVRESQRDTLVGAEYEYQRLQAIQGRLLAQDAIQRYPLEGPRLEGYREHLEQYQDGSRMSGMTPGQLLAAQLDVTVKVQAASAVDQLESSLRQERMLGALLAQEVKPQVGRLRSERP